MARASAAAQPSTEFEVVSLGRIDEGWNARRTFGEAELAELAEDITKRGVLQPVLVRPKGNRYELVIGARRLRASRLAGLDSILCRVVIMTDAEAAEACIVENVKRVDLNPMEEASGYRVLRDDMQYSVEQIAEKVGKSPSTVHGALKLLAATKEVQDAVLDGSLPPSHAKLLARIADPERQKQALEDIQDSCGDGVCSYAEAEDVVHRSYMRELKQAPFDVEADLAGAGPCGPCPKRAGNMGEGQGRADVCTDVACFGRKAAAAAKRRAMDAKAAGLEVLEGARARRALGHGSAYVAMEEPCYRAGEGKTWGELLRSAQADVEPTAVAIVPEDEYGPGKSDGGKAVRLVPKEAALLALAAGGEKWAKEELRFAKESSSDAGRDRYQEEQARRQREAKRRHQVAREAIAQMVGELEGGTFLLHEIDVWRLVAHLAMLRANSDGLSAFAKRRGLQGAASRGSAGYAAKPNIAKAIECGVSAQDLAGVALELLVSDEAGGGTWGGGYSEAMKKAAALFEIDLKKLEAAVRDEEKAKKKKPAKAAKVAEWRLSNAKAPKAHAFARQADDTALCDALTGHGGRRYKSGDRVCGKCAELAGGPPVALEVPDSRRKKR